MAKVDVASCDPELVNCARRAYRAYAANSDGKTFDGRPMPTWEKLTPAVQSHWCAATVEAARYAEELVRGHIAARAGEIVEVKAGTPAASTDGTTSTSTAGTPGQPIETGELKQG